MKVKELIYELNKLDQEKEIKCSDCDYNDFDITFVKDEYGYYIFNDVFKGGGFEGKEYKYKKDKFLIKE